VQADSRERGGKGVLGELVAAESYAPTR